MGTRTSQMCGVTVMRGTQSMSLSTYIRGLYEVLSAGLPSLAFYGSGLVWRVDKLMYGRGCGWWWMVVVVFLYVLTYLPTLRAVMVAVNDDNDLLFITSWL